MKQENLDYLKNQVKYTGFGESLDQQLKEQMEQGKPDFQLIHKQQFGKDEATALLNFRYNEGNGNYYFNSYDLAVANHKEETLAGQKFYIGKDNNFTLKEGYNLLAGRSVNKDLVNKDHKEYNAWVKLDFKDTDQNGNYKMKHFTENYGFKLDEALAKHPIKELSNEEDKGKLIASLYRGNRQQATFIRDNAETKGFVEANPQYKTVTVYDQNMKRVDQGENNKQENSQGEKQSAKNKQKNDEGEDSSRTSKRKNVKKGQGIS